MLSILLVPRVRQSNHSDRKARDADEPDSYPKPAWLGERGHRRTHDINSNLPEKRYAPQPARIVLPPLAFLCTRARAERGRANDLIISKDGTPRACVSHEVGTGFWTSSDFGDCHRLRPPPGARHAVHHPGAKRSQKCKAPGQGT